MIGTSLPCLCFYQRRLFIINIQEQKEIVEILNNL